MADVLGGRYRLLGELGRGGLGSVWRARDELSGREVALKRLQPQFGADPRLRRRLRREARAVARLDHPHIVRLFDLGDDASGPFFVMELARGRPLHQLEGLTVDRLFSVLDQILGALAYAHARGVVHRDLKPENVVVVRRPDGRDHVKLLDFGFAWVEDDHDDDLSLSARDVFGTPHYMAPEQAMRDDAVGPGADLYAVGIIAWELLCGAPPFDGPTGAAILMQHVNAALPPLRPSPELGEIPDGLSAWLVRALQKEPAARFHSAGVMRRALLGLSGAEEITLEGLMPVEVPEGSVAGELDISSVETTSTLTVHSMMGPLEPPIIGRDELRRWLWAEVVGVCDAPGPARVLMLEGESGMGRSRLCDWLTRTVAEGGWMTVAAGRHQQGVPSGLRAALRRALGLDARATVDRQAAVSVSLASVGAESLDPAVVVRCLWPEVGPCPPPRIRRVVDHLVRRLAARRPLLLCLDDLHRAWTEDLDLVEHLVVSLHRRPAPVLILLTRPDLPTLGQPTAGEARVAAFLKRRQEIVQVRRVGRMRRDDVEALIQQILMVDPAVTARLADAARGNPLLALLGLTWMLEVQAIGLEQQTGLHRFVGIPPAIPKQPRALVGERLEIAFSGRRGGALRRLAEHLALVGDAFAFGLAHALAEQLRLDDEGLINGLDALVRLGVLEDHDGDVFAFRNALMRDALVQSSAAGPDPAVLHRPVAEAKQAWYAARPGLAAAEIARHYLAAEDVSAAVRCQLTAAGYARRAWRPKVAMALFAEAERWLSSQPHPDPELRVEVLLGLAETVLDLGQAQRALSVLTVADGLAGSRPAQRLGARVLRGEALLGLGRASEAGPVFEAAARQARDMGAPTMEARASLGRGRAVLRGGDLGAAGRHFDAAVRVAVGAEDRRGEAAAQHALAELALRVADRGAARAALQRAASLLEGSDDEALRGAVHLRLGELARKSGRHAEGLPHLHTAAEAFDAAGNRAGTGRSLRGLGDAQWALGQPEAAATYARAIETFTAVGDGFQLAVCLTQAGRVALEAGRLAAAESAFERAAGHLEQLGDTLRQGLLYGFRAQVAHRRGLETARDLYLDAARRVDEAHPLVFAEWASILEEMAAVVEGEQPGRAQQMRTRAAAVWRALGRAERAARLEEKYA